MPVGVFSVFVATSGWGVSAFFDSVFPSPVSGKLPFSPRLFLSRLLFSVISKILAEFCKLSLFLIHFYCSLYAPVFYFSPILCPDVLPLLRLLCLSARHGHHCPPPLSPPPSHPSSLSRRRPLVSFRPTSAEFFPFSPVCSYRVHISLLYCMFRTDH